MNLGTFSISLTVKDIKISREFYEKLGFTKVGGDEAQNWLIMGSGTTKIGLFQDMFEKNIMTFNPSDARAIQKKLKADGIQLTKEADEDSEGIAHFTLNDPDGNAILFDQHPADHPSMPKAQGKVAWVDLTVPDAVKVRDFYQAVVGWSPEAVSQGAYDDYNMNNADGQTVAGVCHKRNANAAIPSQWMIYINVDTLADSLEKCTALGGKVVVAPRKLSDNSQFAVIEDPAGAMCTLVGK